MRLICRFILVLLTFILIIVLLKSLNFDQYPFKQSAEVNDSANGEDTHIRIFKISLDEVIEELLGSEPNKEGILANGRAQEVSYGLLAVLFKNGPSGTDMNDNKISSTEFSLSVAIVVVVLITSLTLLLTAICCMTSY